MQRATHAAALPGPSAPVSSTRRNLAAAPFPSEPNSSHHFRKPGNATRAEVSQPISFRIARNSACDGFVSRASVNRTNDSAEMNRTRTCFSSLAMRRNSFCRCAASFSISIVLSIAASADLCASKNIWFPAACFLCRETPRESAKSSCCLSNSSCFRRSCAANAASASRSSRSCSSCFSRFFDCLPSLC